MDIVKEKPLEGIKSKIKKQKTKTVDAKDPADEEVIEERELTKAEVKAELAREKRREKRKKKRPRSRRRRNPKTQKASPRVLQSPRSPTRMRVMVRMMYLETRPSTPMNAYRR